MASGRVALFGCLLGLLTTLGCAAPLPLQVRPAAQSHVAAPLPAAAPLSTFPRGSIQDLYVHVPPRAEALQPLTVLLVLHGMGGNGPDMARDLVADADRNGWVLVAPTIAYRDWRDPEQVREDASENLPALKSLLEEMPARTGLALEPRALVYGFSRGGQAAHRLALFYPDSVRRVATFSCGTYTLPAERVRRGGAEVPLEFPYGVGDLARYQGEPFDPAAVRDVAFWLGVGGGDNQPGDVPRQWDPYIGTNRVDRAQAFATALAQLDVPTTLTVFPGAGHEISPEMQARAVAFLRQS